MVCNINSQVNRLLVSVFQSIGDLIHVHSFHYGHEPVKLLGVCFCAFFHVNTGVVIQL